MSNPATNAAVRVILNIDARGGHGDAQVQELEALFARHELPVRVIPARAGEVAQRAREALQDRPEVLVAAGGDGTVSAVAGCLQGTSTVLGVLPMGTLNHFARDLGIPMEIEAAVAVIAARHAMAIDVGQVNDRTFINNASLGLYPDIVRDRTRQQRRLGRGKYRAMLWATMAVLKRSPFLRLSVEINGRVHDFGSPFVFIGNNDYVMEGFDIGTRRSLAEGCLSVYTTQRHGRWGLLRLAMRALLGRLRQADDFAMEKATRLRIDSPRRRLLVATDGELASLLTPLEFRIARSALQVIAPR